MIPFKKIISAKHREYVEYIQRHPFLLIPLFLVYGFLTFFCGFLLAIFIFDILADLLHRPEWFQGLGIFCFYVSFGLCAICIMSHYFFVSFRSFSVSFKILNKEKYIFRVVQLVGSMVFIFAVFHYYVALFSESPAYKGMHLPVPEGGWHRSAAWIDKLIFCPSSETIIDCVYFSTITMATVGYGDIFPLSPMAKILTIVQILLSFVLIVVVLGWVIGHSRIT